MVIPLKRALPATWRRLALLSLLLPYLISGVLKLSDFAGAQAEVAGLLGDVAKAPITAAVIALQLGGSALLLRGGRWAWLGGLALAAFTLAATFLAHRWWGLPSGPGRSQAFNGFWEHIALVGALLYAALMEPEA
ncbi:DoxX family membrane protein [Rhizobacter sp. OV335]|uniref:DoxX family membrane protein n=1 Tax=Rhizobacter sp. OV335 TaxID=1500264 RepID=UPI00091E7B8C|nr:DoxX family membrane protein [Rhizobacter sp. OV335]SHM30600.1 DoxX protein [Rhizobacter sp. OV335]